MSAPAPRPIESPERVREREEGASSRFDSLYKDLSEFKPISKTVDTSSAILPELKIKDSAESAIKESDKTGRPTSIMHNGVEYRVEYAADPPSAEVKDITSGKFHLRARAGDDIKVDQKTGTICYRGGDLTIELRPDGTTVAAGHGREIIRHPDGHREYYKVDEAGKKSLVAMRDNDRNVYQIERDSAHPEIVTKVTKTVPGGAPIDFLSLKPGEFGSISVDGTNGSITKSDIFKSEIHKLGEKDPQIVEHKAERVKHAGGFEEEKSVTR